QGVINVLRDSGVPLSEIQFITHGSTIATNALVEHRSVPIGLLVTHGFRDIPETRRVWREFLFGNFWDRPTSLVRRKFRREVEERVDWQGRVLVPLKEEDVQQQVTFLKDHRIRSIAVCYLFSYLNPAHEERTEQIIRDIYPEAFVTLSSEVNPEIKEYERMSTTLVAASLKPILDEYLGKLESSLREEGIHTPLHIMKSNAGIMSATAARQKPAEIIKSGPAGGISSARFFGSLLSEPNLISVDIGGTTADVGLIHRGQSNFMQSEFLEWDIPIRSPMVDIKSVGAGGGSIAWLDRAGILHVGPQSAGADPGPVCYASGGTQPTVTDAAVTAGLVNPNYFLGGRIRLDKQSARDAIRERIAAHFGWSEMEAAGGLMQIAVSNMAQLIREITINRGYDPRDFSLMAFGGAGPLFAAQLAAEVGIQRAYVPPDPAVFSAWGGLFSDIVHDYGQSFGGILGQVDTAALQGLAKHLHREAASDLALDGVSVIDENASLTYFLDLRYHGQFHELTIPVDGSSFTPAVLSQAGQRFEELHEQFYDHTRPEDPIEVTALRLRAAWATPKMEAENLRLPDGGAAQPKLVRSVHFFGFGEYSKVQVYERGELAKGFVAAGPLIVEEPQSTTVVPPRFQLAVGAYGELLITKEE
ncbi:MAG: hydantoinase/oxoprolinase family protein, partial [Candidatus Thorarchaeota archaeon]